MSPRTKSWLSTGLVGLSSSTILVFGVLVTIALITLFCNNEQQQQFARRSLLQNEKTSYDTSRLFYPIGLIPFFFILWCICRLRMATSQVNQPTRARPGGSQSIIVVGIPQNGDDAVALVRDGYRMQGQQLLSRLNSYTHQDTQEMYDTMSCPICLENYQSGEMEIVLPCFHKFHKECITAWIEEKGFDSVCPVCKQNVKEMLDSSNLGEAV
eukprot:TRINITY_DN4257_c0_g1_i2.p2 TRINITY_DN4257_c0_g1~~TRINITY_DN4257_c0_g1_i2.p2  ORF type:complete len:212 (+),score=7.20 TRINITY_DN4257_c0_g1_i2:78-713(+)